MTRSGSRAAGKILPPGCCTMHWMGHFNYDWVSHLGPIYLGTVIYVVGVVVALIRSLSV
jgi:hypothetical protein